MRSTPREYLALESCVKEIDDAFEALRRKYRGKWGVDTPEEFDPLFTHSEPDVMWEFDESGKPHGPTYCATVEIVWGFLASANDIWVSPSFWEFIPLQDERASCPPSRPRNLDNQCLSLIDGTVTKKGLIFGKGKAVGTCQGGETVYVSCSEFREVQDQLESWFTEVVCVLDESYYGRKRYEPTYLEYRSNIIDVHSKTRTTKELDAEWMGYVGQFIEPDKPNKDMRRVKYAALGITTRRGDALHEKLSPSYWKRTNNKKNK